MFMIANAPSAGAKSKVCIDWNVLHIGCAYSPLLLESSMVISTSFMTVYLVIKKVKKKVSLYWVVFLKITN